MDWFLLFTVGPLLLSVKGIIDLAQMPPTILLPHPGGTGTPTLERIAYLPGAQPPFPPRAFNPTSISPGEDPSLPHPYTPLSSLPRLLVPSHLCKCAALHWPEVSKVSSISPALLQSYREVFLPKLSNCFTAVVCFIISTKYVLRSMLFLGTQKCRIKIEF